MSNKTQLMCPASLQTKANGGLWRTPGIEIKVGGRYYLSDRGELKPAALTKVVGKVTASGF